MVDSPIGFSTQEVAVKPADLIASMRIDLNTTAAVATPEDYKFPFPPYYQYLYTILLQVLDKPRDFSQYGIGLPRGFAKTTWLKLVVLAIILFSRKKFILIVLATERMAQNFLADVEDILSSPNIVAIFGDWAVDCTRNTSTDKEFTMAGRKIKIAAVGAGSSIRGIVRNNKRPDVQIMDDIQTREDAESEVLSSKLFDWMMGTLLYTRSPFGCQHIFVGNMYPTEHCILKKLQRSPDWLTFVTGAILSDGSSLWEDLHPAELLMKELESALNMGKSHIFMSEKQNDPSVIPKTQFDTEKVKIFDPTGEIHQGNFIIIDPSGSKKKSDNTAIGYFELYDNVPHLRKLISERLTPKATIFKALQLAQDTKCSLIVVEDVAYQATLMFWFNEALSRLPASGLQIVPINPKGISKNSRILAMFKQLLAQEITLNRDLAIIVFSMVMNFDPKKTDNVDDVLDILAYAPRVANEFSNIIVIPDPDDAVINDVSVEAEHITSAI